MFPSQPITPSTQGVPAANGVRRTTWLKRTICCFLSSSVACLASLLIPGYTLLKILLAIAYLFLASIASCAAHSYNPIHTDRLVVLYDAGESNALLPVLKKWLKEGKDFRVLVMGTSEGLINTDDFFGRRLVLKDLGINESVTKETERKFTLSQESLNKLSRLRPRVVLTGTSSLIQKQALKLFSTAHTIAYVDNFHYDTRQESFETMMKVQEAAQHVFCPSSNTVEFLKSCLPKDIQSTPNYHVMGKPSLDAWEKQIKKVEKEKVLKELGFTERGKSIVTIIGGYDTEGRKTYEDIINHLFIRCQETLEAEGYNVILQHHPKTNQANKVSLISAIAVSRFVVGYNSSVVFDAALIGKESIFVIPPEAPFTHFAIDQGLVPIAEDERILLEKINSSDEPTNLERIKKAVNLPSDSREKISAFIDDLL